MTTYYGIFDNQAYDLRNGFASTDYERLVTDVATDIVDVTDDDYILNLVANKQTIDLETAWDILDAHDFNLAKIPQYVYELLKASDDAAVVSTENNYFWQGSLSKVELLDKHLNTIETFDDQKGNALMANLSDASGTVTLTVPTKKDLKDFLFLHALSERHAEYHTTIIDRYGFNATLKDYNSLDEIIENEMIEEDETDTSYKATFYFAAVGRWCFENNLNWFFDCLKIDYEKDFLNDLKDNLKEKTITAFFDFIDSEPGCAFIADQEILVTYKNGETTIDVQKNDTCDYTVQNLLDYNIYGRNEIVSEKWLKENYDRFTNSFKTSDPEFYHFLTTHKDDIYPHLTDAESVYELDEFDYMLENNDNIPEFDDQKGNPMANLSCASGYLTLTTATKEDLKDFIFLHVLSEKNAYYDTIIDGIEFLEPTIEDYEYLDVRIDEHKDEEVITNDSYQVTFMFYANGRWNFENNLDWFFNCLERDYNDDAINALRDNLKTQTIKAFFDYTDYDDGCDFIVEQKILLTYDKGTITKDVQESDESAFTVEALLEKNIYDKYEIVSERWLKEHYDEFANHWQNEDYGFADFLRKHKKDIYPYLTDNDHAYLTDFFDAMLENNENITLKEVTYA